MSIVKNFSQIFFYNFIDSKLSQFLHIPNKSLKRIRFMFGQKCVAIRNRSKKHLTQFYPIAAFTRCHQCFQIISSMISVGSFVDTLRRSFKQTIWNIAIQKGLPFQEKSERSKCSIKLELIFFELVSYLLVFSTPFVSLPQCSRP